MTIHILEEQRIWLLLRAPSVILEWPAAGAGADGRQQETDAVIRRQRVAALLEACAVPYSTDSFAPLATRRHDGRPAAAPVAGSARQAASAGERHALRYQWRRDGIDLPGADQDYLVLPAASASDDGSRYSVSIGNGVAGGSVVRKPAVVATLSAAGEPPWRWADLAAQLRGRPDLLATVFAAFRGRCTQR